MNRSKNKLQAKKKSRVANKSTRKPGPPNYKPKTRKKNLIYTYAFDSPGEPYHQMMTKMLVSSIFRTGFSGDVLILTNYEHRVFEHGRHNLKEIALDATQIPPGEIGREILNFKYRSRHFIPAERYEKVMFVDCDCLFLRNPDELLAGDSEIMFAEETCGDITDRFHNAFLTKKEMKTLDAHSINGGFYWIAGHRFQEVMAEWERIDALPHLRGDGWGPDQQSWVRLLLDTKLRKKPFRYDVDVRYPTVETRPVPAYDEAVILHYLATPRTRKLSYMFGDYLRHFHGATAAALLHLIDGGGIIAPQGGARSSKPLNAAASPSAKHRQAKKKNLIYSIAVDPPNAPYRQMMAKILVSSIFRSGFSGDVLVLTEHQHCLYEHGRRDPVVISLDSFQIPRGKSGKEMLNFKYRSRHFVAAERYEKVMYVDCECLFLKNPDRLFDGNAKIMFSEQPGDKITGQHAKVCLTKQEMKTLGIKAINSGFWWIAGQRYREVLGRWERIAMRPGARGGGLSAQDAWVRLLLETKLRKKPFRPDVEVQYPMIEPRRAHVFADASLLHYLNGGTETVSYMFGDYMRHFHAETAMGLLHFIDG